MKSRINLVRRALLALTASAGLLAAPAFAQTKIKFTLDWRFEGPSALFLNSIAKGYFKAEGLDVTIDSGTGSGAAVNRVATGAYDMGFADISALIEFVGNNPGAAVKPTAIYMVYETTPAAVFSLKKNNFKSIKDLQGKTMGAPVFDAGRKAFPMVVKANGMDASKITWKTMDPPLRETMLQRGDVDAITGFTFTSLIGLISRGVKEEDVTMWKYSDLGVQLYGNAVIVAPKFAQENPKAVAGFIRALNKGMKEVIANPEAHIKLVKERDPLVVEATELRKLKMAIEFVNTPVHRASGLGVINKLRLDNTVDQVSAAYGLKNVVSADSIFNSSFLPPAAERVLP